MTVERDEETSAEKAELATRIARDLKLAAGLRRNAAADPVRASERDALRAWQAGRLARTYPDLLAHPRFGAAAGFFLSDLYGPKDFSARDHEIERILPMLAKALPVSGLGTLSLAIELDALSEDLDARMVDELRRRGTIATLDDAAYAAAFQTVGRRPARRRQIDLIIETGEALEALARKPLIAGAIKLMRGPAHAVGLGELHDFLERGFTTFRQMGRASEFLARIEIKECELLDAWLRGEIPAYQ